MLEAEVLPAWRTRKVKDLTRRDVRDLVEAIADRGSPISANRYLALIRKMLNFAIGRDWLEANPAALIPKPGAEQSRERVLTERRDPDRVGRLRCGTSGDVRVDALEARDRPAWRRTRTTSVDGGRRSRRWLDNDSPVRDEEQTPPSRAALNARDQHLECVAAI